MESLNKELEFENYCEEWYETIFYNDNNTINENDSEKYLKSPILKKI